MKQEKNLTKEAWQEYEDREELTIKSIKEAVQTLKSGSTKRSEIGMFMIDGDKVVKVDMTSIQKMKKKALKKLEG